VVASAQAAAAAAAAAAAEPAVAVVFDALGALPAEPPHRSSGALGLPVSGRLVRMP
jgi:hypothetical protein